MNEAGLHVLHFNTYIFSLEEKSAYSHWLIFKVLSFNI